MGVRCLELGNLGATMRCEATMSPQQEGDKGVLGTENSIGLLPQA